MARHVLNRLTLEQVKEAQQPGKYGDGGGLYLIVDDRARKSWRFIYSRFGRRFELGLGSARDVPLDRARKRAAEFREVRALGEDPKAFKSRSKHSITFGDYSTDFIATMRPSWGSVKHADQWVMTLSKYAASIWKMPINEITTTDVVTVLKPRWQRTPETAERLRSRIERVLDSARALGLRGGDNPARWRGHLDQVLPGRRRFLRRHHTGLSFDQMASFMTNLGARRGLAAKALAFTILTAARTSEVLQADWREFDEENAIWVIPAIRMKSRREHRVPLSKQALAILDCVGKHDRLGFVFSQTGRKPLSSMAMAMVLRRMGSPVTVHGFRSTFRSWAAEVTDFPSDVCDMALSHAVPGSTEAAYMRSDFFLKRRRLMELWAKHCVANLEIGSELPPSLEILRFSGTERKAVDEALSNTRCPLCGSEWGMSCKSTDWSKLDWDHSHEPRYWRLIEDWTVLTNQELNEHLISSQQNGQILKSAIIKLELARRLLIPSAWIEIASGRAEAGAS